MLNLKYSDAPDFQAYEKNIGASGTFLWVDPVRYSLTTMIFQAHFASASFRLQDLVRSISQGQFNEPKSEHVRLTLMQYCGIDERKFRLRRRGVTTISMDMKLIVKPLHQALSQKIRTTLDPATTSAFVLLSAYIEFAWYKTKSTNAAAKMKLMRQCEDIGHDNQPLRTVNFLYTRQSTSRYYTSQDNVQAWDLLTVPTFTTPSNYILVWADFSQIDYRIAYTIILRIAGSEYDRYYTDCPDKYEALVRAMCAFANVPFDEEGFPEARQGFKTSILARIYGAGLQTIAPNFKDISHAKILDNYILHNEGHKAYLDSIKRAIEFGVEIVAEDYFGVLRRMPIGHEQQHELEDRALNAPIQTSTNSIVVHWTNAIVQQFQDAGYDEDAVKVYLIRHDETVFRVRKDALKDLWIFENNIQVQVDDWAPLDIELDLGYNYSVPDEGLMELYRQSVADNSHRFTPAAPLTPRPEKYKPIKDVLYVYTFSPSTLEVFAEKYLYGESKDAILALETEDERYAYAKRCAEQTPDSPLGNYCKYYNKFLVVDSDKTRWCLVENFAHILAVAHKQKCLCIHIKCVDLNYATATEEFYIKYEVGAACNIIPLFKAFEEGEGEINKWYKCPTTLQIK